MLLKRIDKVEFEIYTSVLDWEKLCLIMYESYDERRNYPIMINDFKKIKSYFRTLKDKYYFSEYLYSLQLLKKRIEKINDDLIENNLFEEYEQYLFDFAPVKNKAIINDYLIKFIERYSDICVKNHFNEVCEYQKKLNLNLFHYRIPKLKEKIKALTIWLDLINNELLFGKGENLFFVNYDVHTYSNRFSLITLLEKKEIFEKEILLIRSELKTTVSIQNEPEAIDLSDTKAIDKILYLQKLGIIDFLREQEPFNTSVNSLATILSAITGEKSGSLQPMLNPMLSKKVSDTNNPLNSKKAVDRVKKQLINIGFNLDKTN